MRTPLLRAIPTLLLSTVMATVAAGAETSERHVRTVLANDHVRVSEMLVAPGTEVPMRDQPPGVRISLGKSRFEVTREDGSTSVVDYHPGQVLWMAEAERSAWRLLAGDGHLFFVDVHSASSGEAPADAPVAASHSTLVDGEQHRLVLDNAHVRIIDGMAGAGATSAAHSHPPSVLVSLSKSRFRVTIDGRTRVFDFEPAMVRWSNHFEHAWTILSGEARVVMVEIKSAHADPAFRRRR